MAGGGALPEDVTIGEVYRSLLGLREEIKEDIASVAKMMDRVVFRDVYEADRQAVAHDHATMLAKIEAAQADAKAARALALWVIGLLVASILGAVVAAILAAIH